MDSAKSRKRAIIFSGLKMGLVASTIFLVFFFAGYFVGVSGKHHHPAIINSPTTTAPFAFACDHGTKVYTTPQGGIATFPGGKDCP